MVATSCSIQLCLSVQWLPGRFSKITLLPPTFFPGLSVQMREGRPRRVATASAKMGEERDELGPGMERRNADDNLSFSFQLLIPLPHC